VSETDFDLVKQKFDKFPFLKKNTITKLIEACVKEEDLSKKNKEKIERLK